MSNMTNTVEVTESTEGLADLPVLPSVALEAAGFQFGNWYPYDQATEFVQIAGARIVKCFERISEKKKGAGIKAKPSQFCYLPTAHLNDSVVSSEIEELTPYILHYLQEKEDAIIKAQWKKNASRIHTDYLTLAKIVETLEGGRLTGDKVEKWFKDSLESFLTGKLLDKMEVTEETITDEQVIKVSNVLKQYCGKCVSLASGKTVLTEQDRIALEKQLTGSGANETMIGKKLLARLESMKQEKVEQLEEL